jgi:hypothetical protein
VGKGDAHITLKSSNIQGVRNRPNTFATPAESASVFGDDLRFTVAGTPWTHYARSCLYRALTAGSHCTRFSCDRPRVSKPDNR